MLREAIEYLTKQGAREGRVITVWDNGDECTKLIITPDGTHQIEEYQRAPKPRTHAFQSVDSFCAYLTQETGQQAVVMVSDSRVFADLLPDVRGTHTAELDASKADEFIALIELTKGIGHKALWRRLVTDLDGCMDRSLLTCIGQIQVKAKDEEKCTVDNSGITRREGGSSVSIEYIDPKGNGTHTTEIPVDWTYRGRIHDCLEKEYAVELRLEVEVTQNGLRFTFHPKRLARVLDEACRDLRELIQAGVPETVKCYHGHFIAPPDNLGDKIPL